MSKVVRETDGNLYPNLSRIASVNKDIYQYLKAPVKGIKVDVKV